MRLPLVLLFLQTPRGNKCEFEAHSCQRGGMLLQEKSLIATREKPYRCMRKGILSVFTARNGIKMGTRLGSHFTFLAESEGFKPPIPGKGIPDFESSAFGHSANSPVV